MNEFLIRERFRLDNPSAEIAVFTARNGEKYIVKSDRFYNNLDNSGETDFKTLIYVIEEKRGALHTLATLKGGFDLVSKVATLDLISNHEKGLSRIGFGSKMLEFFEKSALNHGIRNIVGVFAPFNSTMSSDEGVEDFYTKNGYGFCKMPGLSDGTRLIYKNFDSNNSPKPAQDEDEYFGSDDYRRMLLAFKSESEIDEICGSDDDLYLD